MEKASKKWARSPPKRPGMEEVRDPWRRGVKNNSQILRGGFHDDKKI